MKTPYQRLHANRETRHHLLFEKPVWTATPMAKQVRELGSYVVGVRRAPHDYLHQTITPPQVPVRPVLDAMFEIGREYAGWQNDQDRIDRMMDTFAGFAQATRSPEQADHMLGIMTSIEAQMAVVGLFKGLRPRYE